MSNRELSGRVAGRIALVTGAGSGIGRGAAIALAAEGAHLIVTDIDERGLTETVERIHEAGGAAVSFHHDVTDEARWQAILATVQTTFGGLHILVNNAATNPYYGPTTGMSDEVSWGVYIANFTFLVGLAAGGVMMVIPAYLYHDEEMHDLTLIGELLAIAALIMAICSGVTRTSNCPNADIAVCASSMFFG